MGRGMRGNCVAPSERHARPTLACKISLITEGDNGIDPGGAARWDKAGRYRDRPEQESGSAEQSGAVRRHLVELGSEESAQGKCGPEAEEQPDHDRLHPLRNDKPQNVARL